MKILVNRIITLFVKPHSKKVSINQLTSETYEVAVSAPPEKGKANKEIIEVLANFLKINKNQIHIIKGHKSRTKIVEIEDFSQI